MEFNFANTILAGVAIMALGSLAADPDSGLKIVPCGMNYFHAHKFRSRAVVEFGTPVEVPRELVNLYVNGERREATRQLLETVYQALVAVTVTSPDYDTLMVRRNTILRVWGITDIIQLIQAARRLYNPTGKKLPLPMIVELNRRLVKGYTHYKDDPRIVQLKKNVNAYNEQLWLLGVRDHQVEYAKFSIIKVVFTLIYRLGKLAVLSIGTLPGLTLFAPVFIATKIISIRKSREALAASTVKLQGRDVMATWKLLVAMAFAPALYWTYTILLTWWTYRNRVQGYVPEWVPLWMVVIFGMVFFPSITFAPSESEKRAWISSNPSAHSPSHSIQPRPIPSTSSEKSAPRSPTKSLMLSTPLDRRCSPTLILTASLLIPSATASFKNLIRPGLPAMVEHHQVSPLALRHSTRTAATRRLLVALPPKATSPATNPSTISAALDSSLLGPQVEVGVAAARVGSWLVVEIFL